MIRFIIRLIAFLFILAALAALAIGVYLVVDGHDLSRVGYEVWIAAFGEESLQLAEPIIERYVAPVIFYPDLWFDVVSPMLVEWPAWQILLALILAPGVVGLLLWRIGGIGRGRRATRAD